MRPSLLARARAPRPDLRRGTALGALGAVVLTGAAPVAALAAENAPDDVAPDATDVAAASEPIVLPAAEPVDQLVVDAPATSALVTDWDSEEGGGGGGGGGTWQPPAPTDPTPPSDPTPPAPADPAPSDPAPADPAASDPAPADPAASDPAPSDPAPSDPAPSDPAPGDGTDPADPGDGTDPADPGDGTDPADPGDEEPPFEPPCVEGCYGTGKVEVGARSYDDAPLAGVVVEYDVSSSPGPDGRVTTDSEGSAPYLHFGTGESVTLRVVEVPEGTMVVGETSATFGPCWVTYPATECRYDFDVTLVREYRDLTVDVVTDAGAPLAGATFELWGVPGAPVGPITGLRALREPVPAGAALWGTATSDAGGHLAFGPVPPGTYYLRAVTLPPGVTDAGTTFTVVVPAVGSVGGSASVVVPVSYARPAAPAAPAPVAAPVAVVPVAAPAPAVDPRPVAAAAPTAPARAALASTGAEPAGVAALAGALVALGAAATVTARRAGRRA